jgi:hypothetical protein
MLYICCQTGEFLIIHTFNTVRRRKSLNLLLKITIANDIKGNYIFAYLFAWFLRQDLAMYLRLALSSRSSCPSLPSTGTTGMHHHAWLKTYNFILILLYLSKRVKKKA